MSAKLASVKRERAASRMFTPTVYATKNGFNTSVKVLDASGYISFDTALKIEENFDAWTACHLEALELAKDQDVQDAARAYYNAKNDKKAADAAQRAQEKAAFALRQSQGDKPPTARGSLLSAAQ